MGRFCKVTVAAFFLLYAVAILIFLTGTFGWFGQETDPLSGIFLVPLGLPWNLWLDSLPDSALSWAAVLAPAVNLVILAAICRALTRART